jgi:predicted RNase H-like HicB family nuclease
MLNNPVESKDYSSARLPTMQTIKFVYWEEDGAWLGYLQEYPDYWTQGETLDDLKDHLRDLYQDLTSGAVPSVRKVDELIVS